MNEIYEALKGFTDIPIVIISLILGILSKNEYRKLYFYITFSALLGSIVHVFSFPIIINKTVWFFIFFFLFQSFFYFTICFIDYLGNNKENKILYISKYILYLITCLFTIYYQKYDILWLLLYAIICLCFIISSMIKIKKIPLKAKLLIYSVLCSILLQLFSETITYAIVIEHLFFILMLIIFFKILQEKNMKA